MPERTLSVNVEILTGMMTEGFGIMPASLLRCYRVKEHGLPSDVKVTGISLKEPRLLQLTLASPSLQEGTDPLPPPVMESLNFITGDNCAAAVLETALALIDTWIALGQPTSPLDAFLRRLETDLLRLPSKENA